jgi:hypothetical protein
MEWCESCPISLIGICTSIKKDFDSGVISSLYGPNKGSELAYPPRDIGGVSRIIVPVGWCTMIQQDFDNLGIHIPITRCCQLEKFV